MSVVALPTTESVANLEVMSQKLQMRLLTEDAVGGDHRFFFGMHSDLRLIGYSDAFDVH